MPAKVTSNSGFLPIFTQPKEAKVILLPTLADAKISTSKKSAVSLPNRLLDYYRQSPREMLFLQMGCNVATRIGSLTGNIEANPALGVPSIALLGYHDFKKASRRLKIMMTAAKVSSVTETLFQATQAIDAIGKGVNNAGRSMISIATLSGFAQMAVLGMLFTVVLPRFFMVTSIIGLTGDIWSLLRVAIAYKKLAQRQNDRDFTSLIETLEFLKEGSDKNVKAVLSQQDHDYKKEIHKETHFRIGNYETVKAKIDGLFTRLNSVANEAKVFLNDMDKELLTQSSVTIIDAFQKIDDPKKSLSKLLDCYEAIERRLDAQEKNINPELLKQIREKRDALKMLFREAKLIVKSSIHEMRLQLLNQVLQIVISMLLLSSCSIAIFSHEKNKEELANILSLVGFSLHMSRFLFDKNT